MRDHDDFSEVLAHQVDSLHQALATLGVLAAEALINHQRLQTGASALRQNTDEGTLRADAFRNGEYVDSLAMARLRGPLAERS